MSLLDRMLPRLRSRWLVDAGRLSDISVTNPQHMVVAVGW
jgi:hypothetical protein